MPHRIWIHESNIVSAEPVIENTEAVVVSASHFTDHTAELRLMKRDIAKLQSQLKQVRSQNKSLEKDIKQRDDWLKKDSLLIKTLKEDYDSLSKEHEKYKQNTEKYKQKSAGHILALGYAIQKLEHILDRCVEVGYVKSYTKVSDVKLDDLLGYKINSEICITRNKNNELRTYDMMIEEMRKCEKRQMIQQNIINSLQGKETIDINEWCKDRDKHYAGMDGTKIQTPYNIHE